MGVDPVVVFSVLRGGSSSDSDDVRPGVRVLSDSDVAVVRGWDVVFCCWSGGLGVLKGWVFSVWGFGIVVAILPSISIGVMCSSFVVRFPMEGG